MSSPARPDPRRHAVIVSTGSYLPAIEVPNETLAARFPPSKPGEPGVIEKFENATGIRRRWYAPDDLATSDLAVRAARQALDRAGRRSEDLDLILLGTDSPDFVTPATSVVVQQKLGATNAGTFDIGCACASFPTALATAAGWIAVNPAIQTVLVIGAYLMRRHADPDDPTIFFYGDGAGAAVLEAGDEPGFVCAATHADGTYHRRWGIFSGGTAEPASIASVEAGRTKVRMLERYPPEINDEGWPHMTRRLAQTGGFSLDDVALFVFTQVRKPTIELVMAELGLPVERAHMIMEDQGYTGSACIGMAFDDALRHGKASPGDLVLFLGSGVGYNQAGTVFRLTPSLRLPS